jgi:hypothetical protein
MVDQFAGVFLACPDIIGGKKGYLLYAMTLAFKRGGCITLDWLVYKDLKESGVEEVFSNIGRHERL